MRPEQSARRDQHRQFPDRLVPREPPDRKDRKVPLDRQDRLAARDRKGRPDHRDRLDSLVPLDLKDRSEQLAQPD